jgi:hypothetical protein
VSDVSEFYRPQRTRNLYVPGSPEPFTLSRSKVDLFVLCPRCFVLDVREGTGRVPGYPFRLNDAVDRLLKKEFDAHRMAQTAHRYMREHGINAVPLNHPDMATWQEALRGGVRFHHRLTNLIVRGGPDDVWVTPHESLHVVDYKATSQDDEVTLEAAWKAGYKRQVEFYQWLLRRNGFVVERTAYFVYANADRNAAAFDDRLTFIVRVLPYEGDDAWVEPTLVDLKKCLESPGLPQAASDCDWCAYRAAMRRHEHPADSGKLDI